MKTTIFILIIVSSQARCAPEVLDTATITTIQFMSEAECQEDADALNSKSKLRAACMSIEVVK